MFQNYLKLLTLIIFSLVVFAITDMWLIGLIFLTTTSLSLWLSSPKLFWLRLKPLLIIFIFVLLSSLIFLPGGFWARADFGLLTGLRILSLSLGLFIFNLTTSASSLIRLFWFLPGQFKLVLTIALSLVPTTIQEYNQIQLAQQTRGYRVGTLNFLPVLIPLLHRSLHRAEQIAVVMQTRGES